MAKFFRIAIAVADVIAVGEGRKIKENTLLFLDKWLLNDLMKNSKRKKDGIIGHSSRFDPFPKKC